MPENRWIEHVRKYAKDNGISYGCAVTEAKASYVKAPKAPRKPRASKTPKTDKPKKKRMTKKQAAEVDDYFQKFIDL